MSAEKLSKKYEAMLKSYPEIHSILDVGNIPKKFQLKYSKVIALESKKSTESILTLKPQSYKPFLLHTKNVQNQFITNEEGAAVSSSGSYSWYVLDNSLCEWLDKHRERIVKNLIKEGYVVRNKNPKHRKK